MYEPPNQIIKDIGAYLSEQIPNTKQELIIHLAGLESLRYRLAESRVEWMLLLDEKKNQMLHPKDKDLTEMDRKIMLNASIGIINKDYEFLTKLELIVEDRIKLGSLLLTLL